MRKNLQRNLEGMLTNLMDQKKFFSNPNIPNSKLIKLLGTERPGPITSIALAPHDSRFKKITVWSKVDDGSKIQSVAFYFPDYPIPFSKMRELFGEFETEFAERRKYTLFISRNFEEENPIQDFSFHLKGVKMEPGDQPNSYLATILEENKQQTVTEDMIWVDNYVFYMKDREPVPDPDAKKRGGGFFG